MRALDGEARPDVAKQPFSGRTNQRCALHDRAKPFFQTEHGIVSDEHDVGHAARTEGLRCPRGPLELRQANPAGMVHAVQPGADTFRELSTASSDVAIVCPFAPAPRSSTLTQPPRDLRPHSFDREVCVCDTHLRPKQPDGFASVTACKGLHRPCRVGQGLIRRHHWRKFWSRFEGWPRCGKPVEEGRK